MHAKKKRVPIRSAPISDVYSASFLAFADLITLPKKRFCEKLMPAKRKPTNEKLKRAMPNLLFWNIPSR